MTTPQPRTGAPAFLNGHDEVTAFVTEHDADHRPSRGGCTCGWRPVFPEHTHAQHRADDLAEQLARRLPSDQLDLDDGAYNWPDLAEHLATRIGELEGMLDGYQFNLSQLFEVAQTMKQGAKVVDDLIADRDTEGTYLVAIHRSGTMWEIHLPGVGVTQAASPDEFETMARDYLKVLDRNHRARLDVTWHHDGTTDYLTWYAVST